VQGDDAALFVDEAGGRFRATREVGRGVLTSVTKAEPLGDDPCSAVALKTVLPLWIGHPIAEARIARERELSTLLYPEPGSYDSARILCGGRQTLPDGRSRPFHVSALLDGRCLSEQLKQTKTRTHHESLRWIDDVLGALGRLHRCGWVHRDVKPQNIFLESVGDTVHRATLIDYGLAVPIGSPRNPQDSDEPFGTPAYVSPEVIAGASLDERADLYSLGLVLFELVCGQRPFADRDPIALLEAHLGESAPSVRSVRPELSPQLDHLVRATLSKAPGDRPRTAKELADHLRDCPEANAPST
jgi:serine/threonine protein kinase